MLFPGPCWQHGVPRGDDRPDVEAAPNEQAPSEAHGRYTADDSTPPSAERAVRSSAVLTAIGQRVQSDAAKSIRLWSGPIADNSAYEAKQEAIEKRRRRLSRRTAQARQASDGNPFVERRHLRPEGKALFEQWRENTRECCRYIWGKVSKVFTPPVLEVVDTGMKVVLEVLRLFG